MIRHSGQDKNPRVLNLTGSYEDKDNLSFFAEAPEQLTEGTWDLGPARAWIGLLGQRDLPGVALRRAQAELRWDRRPSLWSHAFVFLAPPTGGDSVATLPIAEVALHSRAGHFPEPAENAVTGGPLSMYEDPLRDANAALIAVGMSPDQLKAVQERAEHRRNLDRLRYDLWTALGVWQTYLWSAGAPNPLREGFPVFSSAFVEYCFEAIELDLSPGASERNSAPEHLWNAARFWPAAFSERGHEIAAACVIRDPHCGVLSPQELWEGGPAVAL